MTPDYAHFPRLMLARVYSCTKLDNYFFTHFKMKEDPIFNKSSAVAERSDRGHNRHGPKRGGCCAPFAGELGPHLTPCGLGQGLLPYQVASSSIQPFGYNRHGPKIGWGGCALFLGVAGSP